MTLTPERRAIERIKRKATGMASTSAIDPSAHGALGPAEDAAADYVHAPPARKCRCDDAAIKAYRDGAEWICHTCGYELAAHASRELTIRALARAGALRPGSRSATRVQRPVA